MCHCTTTHDSCIASNPPVVTAVTGINITSVQVTWNRPTVLNGILANYTIVYTVDNSPSSMSVTVDYNEQPVGYV